MKIAVIGANGQLGSDVVRVLLNRNDDVSCLAHEDIELSSMRSVASCLASRKPAVVINTAAMHHVEKCEQEPERAFGVNAIGVRHLATVTRDIGALLIHISTDYVFDGRKDEPYVEEDTPLPLNVYGNSKLAGEYFVRSINPKHFVLRASALYGQHPCRAKGNLNFVELMLKFARERGYMRVVDSEFVSPTATADLAEQIAVLTRSDAYGLYHATAEGSCSWFEFASEIISAAGLPAKVEVAAATEFPAKVTRPRYSVLENRGLKKHGLNVFGAWQTALRKYLLQTQCCTALA